MAVSRHLGFLEFERLTIRSADPENPTLEPNIMSLMLYTAGDASFKYLKAMAAVRHLVQGHPRSSILMPIESPYATSY